MDDLTRALELLARLGRLSKPGDTPANRVTLRTPDGEFAGETVLSAKAVEALTMAVESLVDYAADAAGPSDNVIDAVYEEMARLAAPYTTASPVPLNAAAFAKQHRELAADITDVFADVDPLSYLDDVVAADCPEAAQAAYEQLVTGEWDGEL